MFGTMCTMFNCLPCFLIFYDMAIVNSNENKNVRRIDVSRPYDPSSGIDERQWNSNPYAITNFRLSPFQNLLIGLGFRSKLDAYKESMQVNANEYYAQLAEKAHNEEYDSPLAQAQRMAEAGLNPDLQNISGGESSAMQPDPNGPIDPGDEEAVPLQVASIVLSAVQMAEGLASTAVGFASSIQELRGKKIANDDAKLKLAHDAVLTLMSPDKRDSSRSGGSVDTTNYILGLQQLFGKRNARKYVDAVNRSALGLRGETDEFALRSNRAQSRINWNDLTSNTGYSEDDEALKLVRKFIAEDMWKASENNAKYSNLKAQNDSTFEKRVRPEQMTDAMQYAQAQSGTAMGKADQRIKENEAAIGSMKASMRSAFDTLIQGMNELADGGDKFAGFLATALSLVGIKYFGF